jgi:AP-3 complex subunit mu
LIYEASINPPTLIHSIIQDRILFIALSSTDGDPLIILEFLHRLAESFTDFLGSPLLPHKLTTSYDILAQLLPEACDAGQISTTESNALRDLVDSSSWVNKLLGGPSPSLAPSALSSNMANTNAPAIPWRRANVRYTSNEMYVDMVETLHVITAPSGFPLVATAHGSVVFTAKISGVPDILLTLNSAAGGPTGLRKLLQLPVFHPCVRLARWTARPGEVSFVPPDGRFVLLGYEVDLLGEEYLERAVANGTGSGKSKGKRQIQSALQLPATVTVRRPSDTQSTFIVSLHINRSFTSLTPVAGGSRPDAFGKAPGLSSARVSGTSSHPVVEDVLVRVPIPPGVRSLGDLKPSRGEARWAPGSDTLEWRLSSKDIGNVHGHGLGNEVAASLRCVVQGELGDIGPGDLDISSGGRWDYDVDDETAQNTSGKEEKENTKQDDSETLMPTSASVSFQVRGWLASGIKVDKLMIDSSQSRGLAQGVQPYKGVKYVTISQNGVETRC